MPRLKQPIRVESYVHVRGVEGMVNTKDLTEEQRRELATQIHMKLFNAAFRGIAEAVRIE